MKTVETFTFACEATVSKTDCAAFKKRRNFELPTYMLGDNTKLVARNNKNLFSN